MALLVNRCDELGVDPLTAPEAFLNLQDRKREELRPRSRRAFCSGSNSSDPTETRSARTSATRSLPCRKARSCSPGLADEGHTIPIARVVAMHEGKRRARERRANET